VNKTDQKNNNLAIKALDAVSAVFFVVITAAFPLYITRTHYGFITYDKADIFMTVTFAATITIIGILFLTTNRFCVKDYFVVRELTRYLSVAEWALVVFLMFTLLSAVFSQYQEIVWRGNQIGRWESFRLILCYVLTFFIIARWYKPRRVHFLIFAAGSMLVSLYGIMQFMGHDILLSSGFFMAPEPSTPAYVELYSRFIRLFRTTLGNVNIVSAYGALAAVLFAGLFAGENSKWGIIYVTASALAFSLLFIAGLGQDGARLGLIGAMGFAIPYWVADHRRLGKILITLASWSAVFAVYSHYLTLVQIQAETELSPFWGDRNFISNFVPRNPGLFLGLAALLALLGLVLILFVKVWPQRPMKIAGVVLLITVLLGGLVLVEVEGARREGQPNNIIWQAREMMHGRVDDHFGSGRGFVWLRSLPVIMDNPVLGTGPGTFLLAMGEEFQQESMERFRVVYDTAHNTYLQIAVNLGLPALAAYLTFLAGIFLPAIKKAYDSPILLAFGAASLSCLILGFFQVDTPIDRPLLWVCLGVMSGELWRLRIGVS